jgi:Thoeris protein ThsB, TIR-like domain
MINITYSASHKALAERIRNDLAKAGFRSEQSVLLVLVSAESNTDPLVQDEIKRAVQKGVSIIPILAESVSLPEALDVYKPLNFSGSYKWQSLMTRLSQTTMSRDDMKQANRRALFVVGGIALVMFAIGIVSIMGGQVAFPVDEYNEEATYQAEWVNGLIVETLESVQPRTTQDAINFDATLEAVPQRIFLYVRETATALPKSQGD